MITYDTQANRFEFYSKHSKIKLKSMLAMNTFSDWLGVILILLRASAFILILYTITIKGDFWQLAALMLTFTMLLSDSMASLLSVIVLQCIYLYAEMQSGQKELLALCVAYVSCGIVFMYLAKYILNMYMYDKDPQDVLRSNIAIAFLGASLNMHQEVHHHRLISGIIYQVSQMSRILYDTEKDLYYVVGKVNIIKYGVPYWRFSSTYIDEPLEYVCIPNILVDGSSLINELGQSTGSAIEYYNTKDISDILSSVQMTNVGRSYV